MRESPDEQVMDVLGRFSDFEMVPVSVLKVLFRKIITQIQGLEDRMKCERAESDSKSPMCLSEC
jgi:hypothetical protein